MATIVAAAFVLFLPTPASAENWDLFIPELLVVYLGPLIEIPYAIAVLIALAFKGFRSRDALIVSLILSAIASVPAPLALVAAGKSVEQAFRELRLAFLIHAVLLCFVWIAPIVQYRWLNKR